MEQDTPFAATLRDTKTIILQYAAVRLKPSMILSHNVQQARFFPLAFAISKPNKRSFPLRLKRIRVLQCTHRGSRG